jgi:hypothetical protein
VAGCRREADSAPDDLYPDPDAPPLRAALRSLGASSALVSWDDPSIAWDRFSHVVISGTWDSVDRPDDYLAWARRVGDVTRLVNPAELIEWNLDKTHHRELDASGIATVPTEWVSPGEVWSPPTTSEFVVKPSVSAGGRDTVRYAADDHGAVDHVRALQDRGQTVMVQPYLESIDTRGEVDTVFVAGIFSHAVKKRPSLRLGEGLIERPWERMEWEGVVIPTDMEIYTARAALAVVRDRFGIYPVYGRVDLIAGPTGEPTVLEMELIDPYLSLDVVPQAAARMAQAILSAS